RVGVQVPAGLLELVQGLGHHTGVVAGGEHGRHQLGCWNAGDVGGQRVQVDRGGQPRGVRGGHLLVQLLRVGDSSPGAGPDVGTDHWFVAASVDARGDLFGQFRVGKVDV